MRKLLPVFGILLVSSWSHGANYYNWVQISTNPATITPPIQNGAINISSGTLQNANFPTTMSSTGTSKLIGAVTLGGAGNSVSISSNAVMVGTTFYQNGTMISGDQITANNFNSAGSAIPGNGFTQSAANVITFYTNSTPAMSINSAQAVSFSSNAIMQGATFYQGAQTQISSATFNTITVSSNTILPGATFYQGASPVFGSSITFQGPILVGASSNPGSTTVNQFLTTQSSNTAPIWSCKGAVINVTTVTVSGSAGTATSTFPTWTNTTLSTAYTPKLASSLLIVTVTSTIGQSAANHVAYATIGTGGGSPGTALSGATVSRLTFSIAASDAPIALTGFFFPNSAGATTIVAMIATDGTGTTNFGDTNVTSQMMIQEICQQ